MKDIYTMKLHERFDLDHNESSFADFTEVLRVPGGWIYVNYSDIKPAPDDFSCFNMTSTFVPWHDSGRQIASNGNYEELREKLRKAEAIIEQISNEIAEPLKRENVKQDYERVILITEILVKNGSLNNDGKLNN